MTFGGDSMMSAAEQSFMADQTHGSGSLALGGGGDEFSEHPDWQARLELDWFPLLIQQKLLEQQPFVQHDWSSFMTVIFERFFSLECPQPRNPRQWYTNMTALIVEKYPHLFGAMTLPQRLAFMRNKLIHKFKNGRFKVQTSMRPKPPAAPLP
ncbi:hypothetical protein FJT64_010857 [Amphibalanus amphitrite]|uniref:Uncharacterized protein n=2 Tax=Amphibalanus amphitrite TaxID=1232801 RepID=A0A6A4VKF1_AMPAM|nr:hypothetical protein FJT64_010857 [Amphibalanus amphitrite]